MIKRWLAVLGALCLVTAVPGTAFAADPGRRVVKVGVTQAVDSMNPFLAVRLVSGSLQRLMYSFLTVPDPKTLQPSPDLAVR